jgi:hypothetical protein
MKILFGTGTVKAGAGAALSEVTGIMMQLFAAPLPASQHH